MIVFPFVAFFSNIAEKISHLVYIKYFFISFFFDIIITVQIRI